MTHRKLNITLLISLAFLCMCTYLGAQKTSLDSILKIIAQNNSELKSYQSKINAFNEYARGAKSLDPPQIGAGFFMTPYNTHMWKADNATNSDGMGSFMISAQQMFIHPTKRRYNYTYMKSMPGIDSSMKLSMQNELFFMAKMNYYEWVVMKKKLNVLKSSEELLHYLIRSTELKYAYGMEKLNAYYKAGAMLGDVQIMKVMTEQEIYQKMISINTLMNREKDRLFDIDTTYVIKTYESEPADTLSIIKNRSEYSILSQNINVLKARKNYEHSKRLPDFGIKYDHMFAFGRQPQQFSIMAMVSIPIAPWSSGMYKSTVAGLDFEIISYSEKQQSLVNEVSGILENLKSQIRSKKQQIELSEKVIIPSLIKNYQTELIAYEQNTEMLFMVLDAWQNLKVSQLMYLDQLMELLSLQVQFEKQLEIK